MGHEKQKVIARNKARKEWLSFFRENKQGESTNSERFIFDAAFNKGWNARKKFKTSLEPLGKDFSKAIDKSSLRGHNFNTHHTKPEKDGSNYMDENASAKANRFLQDKNGETFQPCGKTFDTDLIHKDGSKDILVCMCGGGDGLCPECSQSHDLAKGHDITMRIGAELIRKEALDSLNIENKNGGDNGSNNN